MAVRELARTARMQGFVPIASRLIATRYAGVCRGRSLFIVHDCQSASGWSAFLKAALTSAQAHVLLLVGVDEARGIDGISLDRLGVDALVAAIRPAVEHDARIARMARRAARHAHGIPGRFVRLLWPDMAVDDGGRLLRRGSASLAAEGKATYGGQDDGCLASVEEPARPSVPCSWPAPGELAAARRRIEAARAQLAAGRHAPGIRQLRQAVGTLARRADWSQAAEGALSLGSALLRRGRVLDAQSVLDEAQGYASRVGGEHLLIDAATLSGDAWVDLARLGEAERVLAAAVAAARATGDPKRCAAASMSLARCLFWRGRYADAQAALPRPDDIPSELALRHVRVSACLAVGLRDLPTAMAAIAEAKQRNHGRADAGTTAAIASAAAFVHLAVGDLDAVDRDAIEAIAAARAAHDPLRALKARLLLVEAARRRSRTASAQSQLRRLNRAVKTLPPVVRARWELLSGLASGADVRDHVCRLVASTGLGALALYVPPRDGDPRLVGLGTDLMEHAVGDLVAIVRVCQTAVDEPAVLKEVCVRVRDQLHAAAVGFVVCRGGCSEIIAGDGPRLDGDCAERAMAAAIPIAPHRRGDRTEAAAPVHYGGAPIAALSARWTIGSTYNLSRATSVLAMAAAAAAPIVSAALARKNQPVAGALNGLLGATPVMIELRQTIERAAAAPFAVLIEGESGSGKELVARAIHRLGKRRERAFATLNCAALPDDLIEAELFGHARGSFTGAVADRAGVFEEANGGTLFLDEVGELSLRAQAKVLRVIQEGELRRIGENSSRRVDVRLVSATNRDLRQDVEAGRFRLDLLYRLDVLRMTLPPLRERREDIALLAEHIWREATARVGSRATLGAATLAALSGYDWPGNVRELQNVLAALAVRSPKRGVVPPTALPSVFAFSRDRQTCRLDEARRTFEEQFIRAALVRTGGRRNLAAHELGVSRQGLTKRMNRLGILSDDEARATD